MQGGAGDRADLRRGRRAARTARHKTQGFPVSMTDTMIETPGSSSYDVSAAELRSFIERFEHLDAEKKAIADQQKEVMAEAKGRGYDTKVIRKVIALRKRDRNELAEEEAVLEMYKAALGMV